MNNAQLVAENIRQNLVNKSAGIDEFILDIGSPDKKLKHFKQIIPITIHHFYLTDEIKEADYYLNMINTIRTAEQHDTILIYLNTPGGNLYTAIQIMAAMKQSRATIITSLEGQVCSAGTMIFLEGNKSIVHPNSTFMIHNYSHWVGGKGNEVNSQVKYTESFFTKLANQIYGNFLTEDEIKSVTEGKDFWMDSDEVAKRLGDKLINTAEDNSTNDIIVQMADTLKKVESTETNKPKPSTKKVATKKK